MKRNFYTLLFFTLLALPTVAQDFKLFYAKNVTDVTQFRNMTQMDKELKWREVSNGAIDGNRDDVMKVKEMLSQTRMKGLADQQLFWKMRDEMLLCFRIDDPSSKNSNFRVEVNYGKTADGDEIKRTLTTRKYFFANMPMASEEISISVWRVKEPDKKINFRYFVYDWDDENLYIFQLDQKRQSTGDTYKMEYVTSYIDKEGDVIPESHILELKETKFQSFYVPKGQSLTDIYFLTGNEKEGNVKLRMDMDDIHPGIDLDDQLEVPSLLPTFKLAKHENRELMNFNWVGTGLFEKYDTLYIKLFNEKGKTINKANMNVHRVDDDGELVPDNTLKYLGYDSGSMCHKVLTYGHPAYVEILVDKYLPIVYRYRGAAEASTSIVRSDLCSARITLRPGSPDTGGIAVSDQYFRYLHDEAIAIDRINAEGDTVSYALCSIEEQNISGKIPSESVGYTDNAGIDFPKLYNNKPIDKLAQLEVAFSATKGGGSPTARMTVTEVKSKKTHEADPIETDVIAASEFTNFTRDYYFMRYDMSAALPYNEACKLTLTTPTATYDKFPLFTNVYKNQQEQKKAVNKQAAEITSPPDGRKDGADAMESMDLGFRIPVDVKFSLPKGFSINSGSTIDFVKQVQNWFISASWGYEQEGKDDEQKAHLKGARDNAKQVSNYRYNKAWEQGEGKNKKSASASFSEPSFKYEDWMATEMESIFKPAAKHIGWYVQGGLKLAMKMPLLYVVPNPLGFQLEEVSGSFQFGRGMYFGPDMGAGKLKKIQEALDWLALKLDIGMMLDANVKIDAAIKSFGAKKANPYEWSSEDKGFMASATITLSAGAWAALKIPGNAFFNFDAGFRGGAKGLAGFSCVVPFSDEKTTIGGRIYLLGGVQCYYAVRSFIVNVSGNFAFRAGVQWLIPDNDHNPYHSKFPYWLPEKSKKARIIGKSYRTLKAPEFNSLGKPLLNNIFYDANPHFIDGNRLVYNNLGNPSDYNDDRVTIATLNDDKVASSEDVSKTGTAAKQHMRSKRGDKEIVVYQQTSTAIDNAAVNDDTAAAIDADMQNHTQIKASIKQPDGTWKHTDVTPDDGFIDTDPVVTIQEDGKAAVVYKHGKNVITDPEKYAEDPFNNQNFDGELLVRTYDPDKGWSDPQTVHFTNKDSYLLKYDLVMRNDTVLIVSMHDGPNALHYDTDGGKFTVYAWKPVNGTVNYTYENLHCHDFFINRVGKHAAVAMLYERPDSTREIFIKTVNMDGTSDGLAGCDLGVVKANPQKVKIITDRSSSDSNDFAVLWTQQSTIVRDAEKGNSMLNEYHTVLNATRIRLTDSPQLTYPLTVGSDRDSLLMRDFDGYLDDASIKVAYTLTDANTNASVVMYNEKEFTNSFESDVTYSREALLGSSTMPVNVVIRNTGMSAIKAADVTINGKVINIPDVLVEPLQEQKYVVQYPIPADFDGYMQSSVEVEYANVFKARMQSRGRTAPRNLLRQSKAFDSERVAAGSIDCNVVSRSVENGTNTFIVEVIDRSSRGLTPGTVVQVGVYAHPGSMEMISSDAKAIVFPGAFTRMGGVRKAYAELKVEGIVEPIGGYISAIIVDTESNDNKECDDDEGPRVINTCPVTAPCFVQFLPSEEPTNIYAPAMEPTKEHRVVATVQDGGILLSNLEPGDDIRLFSSAGLTVYMGKATSTTHFVPLKRHDVYIISAAKEVFKFTY